MVVICEKPYENAEYNEYFNNYPLNYLIFKNMQLKQ